jgi:hypothetical protein
MPIDRYTRAVLTIIAGALVYIGAMLSGQPASAQAPPMVDTRPQPVRIVGWDAGVPPLPVTIRSGQPLAVTIQPGQPLAVTVTPGQSLAVTVTPAPQQAALPVTITGIRAGAEWDEVRTKAEQPFTRTPGRP